MFGKVLRLGGLLLAGAAVLWVAGPADAAGRGGGGHFGGGHFGGARFGGGHFGGYHFGGFRGGYHLGYGRGYGYRGYGYRSYGYRPYYHHYGYRPYYRHYGYGYPYYYGYYPDSYGYYPYDSSSLGSGSGYDSGVGDYSDYGAVAPSSPDPYTPDAGAAGVTSAPAQADAPAHVTAQVPAGAQLWFEGVKTTSTGAVREFNTPPLEPGHRYHYDVRASWEEKGHTVTQTRRVAVTAGASVRVEFPVPPGTAGQAGVTKAR